MSKQVSQEQVHKRKEVDGVDDEVTKKAKTAGV